MAREFDVVVYGATGYTGRLVAEYLTGRDGGIKWAMAARSEDKLTEVRDLIGAPKDIPFIIADAMDAEALTAMCLRAKVVLSTAGPYQLYGDALVAACAATGTDYVDLTGESGWIAKMMGLHADQAKATGARLVFSCGFDSVPFDYGVVFVQEEAKKRFGAYAPRVRGRVRAMQGGASGGTVASGMATMAAMQKDPSIGLLLIDPFALTPDFKGPAQPELNKTYEDTVTGSWVAPFIMASINTKAVHRTNYLNGHAWGTDFAYDELAMISGPDDTSGPNFAMSPLKPGEGPTKEEREAGFYDVLFVAEYADGRTFRTSVKGDRDPGYGSTSKIIAECAIYLANNVSHEQTAGGCWTTAAAMGTGLIPVLAEKAGLTFHVEG